MAKKPVDDDLAKENARLIADLKTAQEELVGMKAAALLAEGTKSTAEAQNTITVEEADDPFAPQPSTTYQPATPSRVRRDSGNNMTLEGTLESLRIQTEQLLEVHDDIQAENDRFRKKMSLAASPRNTPRRHGKKKSLDNRGLGIERTGMERSSHSSPLTRAAS